MIKVRNLTKNYGNHLAVKGISFDIEPGKIYGLLGPNGAGKSTTMNILTGCLAATSGEVKVDGHDIFEDPIEAKKHIGYLPEQPPVYGEMTPREYLSFVAEAKGVPFEKSLRHVKEVMQLTQIYDVRNRLIKNLSKGYRQRVGIAQAMIGEPDVIILDEPTVGLDPAQIIEIRNLIRKLGRIKTVIISSHILAEISAVCDHVIIISHGNIVANDTLEHLEAEASRNNALIIKIKGEKEKAQKLIGGVKGVLSAEYAEENGIVTATVQFEEGADIREDIFNIFAEAKTPILDMHSNESTLEDIFLELAYGNDERNASFEIPAISDEEEETEEEAVHAKKKAEKEEDDYKPLFSSSDDEEGDE
ncbi:MAG: ABC transporter ATP-binding protein [Clostridia bacterium]|nr:ABC transporter ATP-binding protein [Clostridia bacterium]